MRAALILLGALMAVSGARAADLTVQARTAAGRPVADAVVMVRPAAGVPAGPIRFPWPLSIDQRQMQFHPFVLVAPVGSNVAFPNRDQVRHHVYSFSPAKRFELKLYGRDESRSIRFDQVGTVALGCNIHDSMVAFIKVVDTPYAAKTDAAGQVVLHDIPTGPATLTVWHPYLKAKDNTLARPVRIAAGAAESLVLDIRTPAAHSHGY